MKKYGIVEKEKQSGITLIALVVTIVILIILATISMNAIIGENGLITKAEKAKQLHEDKKIDEKEKIEQLVNELENRIPKKDEETPPSETPPSETPPPETPLSEKLLPTIGEGSKVEKPDTWTSEKVIPINNGNGVAIPLPNDFYYVGGNLSSGIVISDESADANKGTSYDVASTLIGNQFVWIPVSESTFIRTDFNGQTGEPRELDSSSYTEPYMNASTMEINEYNTMKSKVLQYGGFYIARYEAGDFDSKGENGNPILRTTYSTAHTVVSKKGVAPYNYVPWGNAIDDFNEVAGKSGAVYLSKNMYASSKSVTSTLCYGIQWDAMCRYVEDNYRKTTAKRAPELTGSVSTDMSKNIYDLAGNCLEWTMEAFYDFSRVSRSASYGSSYQFSMRTPGNPSNDSLDMLAFRPALYIK